MTKVSTIPSASDNLPKAPKYSSVANIQKKTDKVAKNVNKELMNAREKRYSAEVDILPPLALTATIPSRDVENVALDKLNKSSQHIVKAYEISSSFFNEGQFLKGQSNPVDLNKRTDDSKETSAWRSHNSGLMELAKQREVILNTIKREEQMINGQKQGIISSNDRARFFNAVTQNENFIRGYQPPQQSNHSSATNTQNNDSQSSNSTQNNKEIQVQRIGFR